MRAESSRHPVIANNLHVRIVGFSRTADPVASQPRGMLGDRVFRHAGGERAPFRIHAIGWGTVAFLTNCSLPAESPMTPIDRVDSARSNWLPSPLFALSRRPPRHSWLDGRPCGRTICSTAGRLSLLPYIRRIRGETRRAFVLVPSINSRAFFWTAKIPPVHIDVRRQVVRLDLTRQVSGRSPRPRPVAVAGKSPADATLAAAPSVRPVVR